MKRLLKKPKIAIFRCAIIIASFATLFSFGLPVFAQEGPDQRAEGSPFLVDDDTSLQTSNADWTYNSDPNDNNNNGTVQAITDIFELILKVLYLLLRPLLAIAGASMDNTLVYGDIFYLDKALWQFWQMIRTFANFALGFIFIASIIISFFGAEKKFEKISVKTIIKKLFLAGILINMSWFIVAALLDLSTVLVFSLGAMPLNVIREDVQTEEGLGKVRYLSTHSFYNQDTSLNTSRDQVEHSIVYSCPWPVVSEWLPATYYLPCKVQANKLPPHGAEDENQTRENRRKQYADAWEGIGDWEVWDNINDNYCVYWYDLIEMEAGALLTSQKVQQLRDAAKVELEAQNCSTIDTLMEKAKGMTWPLYTLYATILHMWEVGVTINNKTVVEKWLEFLMRVVVALALFLPLVALAVVLVMRAVILRLVIAFSPLLVLIYVFGFKTFGGEKGKVENIIGLIFLPVFAVFAVSISILFLSLIWRIELIDDTDSCKTDTFSRMTWAPIECDKVTHVKCYSLFNITKLCLTESQSNTWSNIISTLSWLTVNFFWVALMRTIIFFVLTSDKIVWWIAGKIEAFGKWLAGSTPIIPLPMGMTSLWALNQARKDMESAPERLASQQFNQGLNEYMESYGARKDAKQIDQWLSDKVKQASQWQAVTFAPNADFSLPDNTNHTQYPSLGPSLWLAAGKSYENAKWMSFQDAYRDTDTIKYMQENSLYTTESWVKNDWDVGKKERLKLAKDMEIALASKWTSLGRDSLDGDVTRYMLGNYVTQFPRLDSTKSKFKNNADINNIHVSAKPMKKTDWDSFAAFFARADVAWIRKNPEFIRAYPEYMWFLVPWATTTWIDKTTDPANHKTYTITTNVDGAGNITGFQLT